MELLPIILFCALFSVALFAPIRWSIIAYILLSTVDFISGDSTVGVFNALKGIGYPIVLLWRLKRYAGHGKVIVAPIAWIMLVIYAGISCFWSQFPLSAAKITIEMLCSFVLCLGFMRATKAGLLTPSSILVPATVGVLSLGIIGYVFLPRWGDSQHRLCAFTTAQGYASLLAALFCLSLGARTSRPLIRWILCVLLFSAVVFNGSRIYVIGLIVSTVVALLISYTSTWLKAFGVAAILLSVVGLVAEKDFLLDLVTQTARMNRVADTINAIYTGDWRSTGVGTVQFRRGLYQRALRAIGESSLLELTFGHGTSNGRLLRGTIAHGVGDANRAVHNEWLRILYEWGSVGLALWFVFIFSVIAYAYQGLRKDRLGHSRPLLIFLPAFLAGFSTENILAGAGHAENIGFVLLAALAAVSHRKRIMYLPAPLAIPRLPSDPKPVRVTADPPLVLVPPRRQAL